MILSAKAQAFLAFVAASNPDRLRAQWLAEGGRVIAAVTDAAEPPAEAVAVRLYRLHDGARTFKGAREARRVLGLGDLADLAYLWAEPLRSLNPEGMALAKAPPAAHVGINFKAAPDIERWIKRRAASLGSTVTNYLLKLVAADRARDRENVPVAYYARPMSQPSASWKDSAMSDHGPRNWYLRIDGQVLEARWAERDASPFHLANAYAKTWRAEDLTPDEAAALASAPAPKERPLEGTLSPDLIPGLIAHHRPDILQAIDALAAELAEILPAAEQGRAVVQAWSALQDYTGRALAVTMEETGLGGDLVDYRVKAGHLTESEGEAMRAQDAASMAAALAWEASPEGRAAYAAATTSDDGPEDWSTVPPANPSHPMHPSNSHVVKR